MDGNTQPIVAVVGHPIAGNPSQFAIECALKDLDLDIRVSSFDVVPEKLHAALDGLEVLHFHGVIIDDALAGMVGDWCSKPGDTPSKSADTTAASEETVEKNNDLSEKQKSAPINCLFRDPEDREKFLPLDSQAAWLTETVQTHFQQRDLAITDGLWLGARRSIAFPSNIICQNEAMHFTRTPPIELVELANLIVITRGPKKDVLLDAEDWPEDDGSTLVIDLSGGHDELSQVREKGYSTLTDWSRRIGMIKQSLQRWTGQVPSETIVHEAIEEYWAV